MIRHDKSGFTLVELLAVVVILAIILAIAVPSISNVLDSSKKSAFESDAKMLLKAIDLKKLETEDFDPINYNDNLEGLLTSLKLSPDNYESIAFTINGGKLLITVEGKGKWEGLTACGSYHNIKVSYDGCELDLVPPVLTILGINPLELFVDDTYNEPGANVTDNSGEAIEVNIDTSALNLNEAGEYTVTYTATDSSGNTTTKTRTVKVILSESPTTEGVNKPRLAQGMTAIKWSGSDWVKVEDPDTDTSWYNYANGEWANAVTGDCATPDDYDTCSMWVWIPRYIYNISSGWHQKMTATTAGTILVQFSKNTNDNWNSASIGNINEDPGATASNEQWTNHPAFTFGDKELTGIWVAKFKSSKDASDNIKIIPNANMWRNLSLNDAFDKTRSMELNTMYGWVNTGDGIDTHLIKNIEWGAAAYLSQSQYGKYGNNIYTGANKEIYQNKSSTYVTGRSSGVPSGSGSDSCAYNTINDRGSGKGSCGGGASTTGNIYGIYDMAGGELEHVSAYINNLYADDYGSHITSLTGDGEKYSDVYIPSSADSGGTWDDAVLGNYNNAINHKGDGIYETSALHIGNNWYNDCSYMPAMMYPWFSRGGIYSDGSCAGVFYFNLNSTELIPYRGFRPVLLVGHGL